INTPRYTLYYITSYKSTKKPLYINRYSGFSSDYRYTIRECRFNAIVHASSLTKGGTAIQRSRMVGGHKG
ncbi:MAG: hypothetical protein LKI73_14950, partial [Carnobacterium maltaromaticum]|nr:hypothetical protein [Carnobacterium maltaromaticum]